MSMLVWTQKPDPELLLSAIRKSMADRFSNKRLNENMADEAGKFIRSVGSFISSAAAEGSVNLAYGSPWKVLAFKRRLQLDLQEAAKRGTEIQIYDYLLDGLGTRAEFGQIPSEALNVLEGNGPCLLVSNHSYPPFDGLAVLSLMQRYRQNFAILVNSNNSLLRLFPEHCGHTIPLHMDGGLLGSSNKEEVRRSQITALRRTIGELKGNGIVSIFPAGQGSKALRWNDPVVDLPWQLGVGHIVSHFGRRQCELDIIPLHVVGHMGGEKNSAFYQWAAIERPSWLQAALQLALFNPPPAITVRVGAPISAKSLDGLSTAQVTEQLRQAVYVLGNAPILAKKGVR